MSADDNRRITVLEVEFAHLREDLKETREALHKTNNKLQELYSILNQGKGVTIAFRIALVVLGSGGAITLINLIWGVKP